MVLNSDRIVAYLILDFMGGKTEDRIQKSWQPREILMCLFSVSAIAAFIAYYYSTTNFATAQAIDIGDAQNWKRPEQTEQPLRQRDPHWGSWKPGLYFGLRSHHYPAFTSTGIMWTKEHMTVLRHAAKQDEVSLFEWIRHDGKRYGKHLITDEEMGTKIMSSFAIPIKSSAATWAQRFEISSVGDPLSFFFYFGSDCDGNLPEKSCFGINPSEFTYISEVFESKASESDPAKSLIVRGRSDLSGSFEVQFHMTADGENDMSYWSPSRQTLPYVVKKVQDYVSSNKLHSIRKDNIFRNDSTFRFSNRWSHNSSALAIQLSVSGAATLDILYKEYIDNSDGGSSESSVNDNPYMTKSLISKWMQELEHDFEDRYNRSYGCKGPKLEASHAETSKKIISAVVGGIGLFMGYPNIGNSSSHQILNSNSQIQAVHGAPVQLLTGTPSRTSFPRGFLWDEVGHLHYFCWDELDNEFITGISFDGI